MENPLSLDTVFTVGDAEAIAGLQHLRHLRLHCCVTAPLTDSVSRLTQLTSLEVVFHDIGSLDDSAEQRVCCISATMSRVHLPE